MIRLYFTYLLLLTFIANRSFSKISIAYFDLISSSISVLVLLNTKLILSLIIKKFWGLLPILFISIGWLIYEAFYTVFDVLNIRRFAFVLYLFIPILIVAYRIQIKLSLGKVLFIMLVMLLLSFTGLYIELPLRVSLLAVTSGFLIIYAYFYLSKEPFYNLYILVFLSVFIFFVFYPSLFLEGGMYRTPFFGFVASIIIVFLYHLFRFIFLVDRVRLLKINLTIFILVVSISTMFFSAPGQKILYELFMGLYGLSSFGWLKDAAELLGVVTDRGSRGSAGGTSETRMNFWISIMQNSVIDIKTFLIGNGHAESFFDKLFPFEQFKDQELLAPHNSIMSILYMYGFLGVFSFFIYLFQVVRYLSKQYEVTSVYVIVVSFYAFFYISFEVALEAPHGAIIFWLMLLSFYIFRRHACKH